MIATTLAFYGASCALHGVEGSCFCMREQFTPSYEKHMTCSTRADARQSTQSVLSERNSIMSASIEAMHKTILLVSRDEALRTTRATILEKARHLTIQASRMQSALQLAAYCHLAVIDATFSIAEHDEFIHGLRDQGNHACVLCIRSGLTHPVALLDTVQDCLSLRIASRVCVLEGGNLIQPTN